MKKFSLLLLFTVLVFTGCNTYRDEGAQVNRVNDQGIQIQNVNEEHRFNSYNQTYRMHVDNNLEEQVEMLGEVQSATIITVQRKAYVAVVLENGDTDNVSGEVKRKIAEQIRSIDESISEVYISSNADFAVEMQDYRDQLQSGRPIVGLTEKFNTTIERSFPQAR
ncbi:YhcN/YlaJ family sporulation lipoprotein [Mesobacillus subterraneus]|uniref:YhcN/YlaJ family sporulation lipoprotein n=1 Tax=Mesobacillus subterraneus TaxID=285983 RepID=A0A3R9E5Y2_9BACI|nr:YhcN/YlaJ family sporulation lipoprotein [Mesobacillus subterraneus]RSD24436.1 YhcN/YlaJ family sporulation lipoprotein [Mesobacillus subterraneus]